MRAHDNLEVGVLLADDPRVLLDKWAEGRHAVREVKGVHLEGGQRVNALHDLFRGRQGRASRAADDADQFECRFIRVAVEQPLSLPHVRQAYDGRAIRVLRAVRACDDADSGHALSPCM